MIPSNHPIEPRSSAAWLAGALLLTCAGCGDPGAATVPGAPEPEAGPLPKASAVGTEDEKAAYQEMLEKSRLSQQDPNNLLMLQRGIHHFQTDYGRNPSNLVELVTTDYVSVVPEPPAGKKFDYDAKHGNVKVVALNPRGNLGGDVFKVNFTK